MKKTLQLWSTFIFILFLFPIILNFLPEKQSSITTKKMMKEPLRIVYASNVFEDEIEQEDPKKVLLYYTHNQEAYEPVTAERNGKVAVSHRTENITRFGDKLKAQFDAKKVDTKILPVNNTEELSKKGMRFSQAYHSIRPFVQKEVQNAHYDLIIDLHRDSIGKKSTTMTYEGNNYARVAFVVGLEHESHKKNEEKAVRLKKEMEKIAPGITRNIIRKGGPGVDGKYNQDLHQSIVLVELGGPENTEAELNMTISVLAEAATNMLEAENSEEN